MTNESNNSTASATRAAWVQRAQDFWTLTKPEVNLLVVFSTLAGFLLASKGPMRWALVVHALLGTFLVASGTATLNQWMERDADARMRRTARRPLPAGRLSSRVGLLFGLLLALAGGLELALGANLLASFLALLTLASYLLAYTPLKRKTPLCTLVGAFPGAMPPLIGWAAAQGRLTPEAWVLYALLFFWQFPHFLGIAWLYREDYERAGLRMLPAGDRGARAMAWQVVAASFALLLVSLSPVYFGRLGAIYFAGAVLAGLVFAYIGAWTARVRSKPVARRLVLASVFYLPLVLGLMVVDKICA
jgi:heme o synthase